MELEQRTYNLTRKLYSDARRLIASSSEHLNDTYWILVRKEDLDRLQETLTKLKNSKKD